MKKVRQLIKELLDHDMEEMVIFMLCNEEYNTLIWYPDVQVSILKDRGQDYIALTSKEMSKDLYETETINRVLGIIDERIEYHKQQIDYFEGHFEENSHNHKIILDELNKIKKWI